MRKQKHDAQPVGAELDVSDLIHELQTEAKRLLEEEIDAAEREGLSEDEAHRRASVALTKHQYRNENRQVSAVPTGLRERMAARLGCRPEEVDEQLRCKEAMDRIQELVQAVTDSLEQERDLIEEEIENGQYITDEQARGRLLAAHQRGWDLGLQNLQES